MARRRKVRHYSVLQDAVDETTTTTTATTKSTTTLPLEHASPNTQTLEVDDAPQARSKRRALDSPASSPSSRVPSSSSFSTSDVVRNLSTLPAEILLRVAELLEPRLSPFNADGSGGVSPSEEWLDPGRDLIQFSSTSRTIYIAVRSLVGRRFGIEMDGYAGGIEAEARVRSIVSNGEPGALPSFEEEQTSSNDFTRAKSVGQGEDDHADVQDNTDDESQPLPPSEDSDDFSLRFRRRPRFTVPGDRIRHFYVHIRSAATALHNQSATLAQSIRSMPRLESFACVFTNEETVTSSSPYALAVLGYEVLEALSTHPTLREIYLCGIKLAIRIDHFRDEEDPLPTFGPQLRSLVMSASHDTVLRLVPAMPGLKEVKLWRDFARGARIVVEDWWDKTVWEHLEHVELTGFSGTHGRPLLDKCMQALIDLRSTSPETVIPLRSLRLCEAYSYSNFVSNVLPSFSALPNLRSFTCMVWRDRHFGPQLLRAIAEHMPHLEELGVAVENSSLNWWPQQLSDYGAELASMSKLQTFTWNFTMYSEVPFDEARQAIYGPAVSFASRAPALRTIRWLNEGPCLQRSSPSSKWRWSDEKEVAQRLAAAKLEAERVLAEQRRKKADKLRIKGKGRLFDDDKEDTTTTTLEHRPTGKSRARRTLFAPLVAAAQSNEEGAVATTTSERKLVAMPDDFEDPVDAATGDSGFFDASDLKGVQDEEE